jgi:hypothetical protein
MSDKTTKKDLKIQKHGFFYSLFYFVFFAIDFNVKFVFIYF